MLPVKFGGKNATRPKKYDDDADDDRVGGRNCMTTKVSDKKKVTEYFETHIKCIVH